MSRCWNRRKDRAAIAEAYTNGERLTDIAARFHCHPGTVQKIRREFGVASRDPSKKAKWSKNGSEISDWEKSLRNRTIRNRYAEGVPANHIADEVKLTSRTVIRIMRKLGLKPRTPGDVNRDPYNQHGNSFSR